MSENFGQQESSNRLRQLLGQNRLEVPKSRLQTEKKSATVAAPAPVRWWHRRRCRTSNRQSSLASPLARRNQPTAICWAQARKS